MGEKLAGGNVAIALLANTIATGAALVALILTFGAISGAHFNPVVTLADAIGGGISWWDATAYAVVQIVAGILGAVVAHLMFGLPVVSLSLQARPGWSLALSEFIAAFGLLAVILGCARFRSSMIPFAVGSYITAAYWFTASTSFANPAVREWEVLAHRSCSCSSQSSYRISSTQVAWSSWCTSAEASTKGLYLELYLNASVFEQDEASPAE
jgi:glycerol uptake facilitator-like aquaporin